MTNTQEDININIKQSNGKKLSVSVSSNDTIFKLKEGIAGKSKVPVDRQRLVYCGKVLKDEETVVSYNLKNDFTVHLVHRNPALSAQASSIQKTSPTTPQTTTSSGQQSLTNLSTGVSCGRTRQEIFNHSALFENMSSFMMDRERTRSLAQTNPIIQSLGITPEKIEEVIDLWNDPMARAMFIEMKYGIKVGPGHPQAWDKSHPSDGSTHSVGELPPGYLAMRRNYAKDVENGEANHSRNLASLRKYDALLQKIYEERKQLAANLPPPEVRFQVQIKELKNMRFHDTQKNISALLATGGDVQSAVEYLCADPQ